MKQLLKYHFKTLLLFGFFITLTIGLHLNTQAAAIVKEYVEDSGRKVIEIESVNSKKSSDKIIQKALASNDNEDLKVILKPGEYTIRNLIKVFDNTELVAEGATITQKKKGKGLLINARYEGSKYGEPNASYNSCKNITIDGGTWIGQTAPSTAKELKDNGCYVGYSNFMFLHGKNITIKNLTIKNNYNGHLIEFGGIKDSSILNCNLAAEDSTYSGEPDNEAIQLDNTYEYDNSPVGAPYDDTPCQNITIKDCKIKFAKGIGTNPRGDSAYSDIIIKNNTIISTKSEGINLYDCESARIVNNKIKVEHDKMNYQSSACRIGISEDNDDMINPSLVIKGNNMNGYLTGLNISDTYKNGYSTVVIKNNKLKARYNKKNALNINEDIAFEKIVKKDNKIS